MVLGSALPYYAIHTRSFPLDSTLKLFPGYETTITDHFHLPLRTPLSRRSYLYLVPLERTGKV